MFAVVIKGDFLTKAVNPINGFNKNGREPRLTGFQANQKAGQREHPRATTRGTYKEAHYRDFGL